MNSEDDTWDSVIGVVALLALAAVLWFSCK
jgi:hypothetical protein